MARRNSKLRAERAWIWGEAFPFFEFESGVAHGTIEPLMEFNDIETDEGPVHRETSEYYVERLIMWWWPYMSRDSLLDRFQVYGNFRVGVVDDRVDHGLQASPDFASDAWVRILQEEFETLSPRRPFSFEGASLVAEPSEGADFSAWPYEQKGYKWDLVSKFSLREDSSLVFAIAAPDSNIDNGTSIGADVFWKALLRKRNP